MINIVMGKPGTGKTFFLVYKAYKAIKQGIDVYSNFYINFDNCLSKDQQKAKIIFFEEIHEIEKIRGGIILIDECQIYFNSRDWKNLSKSIQYKLQQHRHHIKIDDKTGKKLPLDIYGATQNVKRIDTVVRELVNNIYICKNLPYCFMVKQYDIEEIDKVKKYCYSTKFVFKSKKLCNSYDTYETIDYLRQEKKSYKIDLSDEYNPSL